jgi:hypothetical protein
VNIYTLQNPKPDAECFTTLHQNKNLKIEAIRSHLLQPGEIYNQAQDEWVVLIRGHAQVRVEVDIIEHVKNSLCTLMKLQLLLYRIMITALS